MHTDSSGRLAKTRESRAEKGERRSPPHRDSIRTDVPLKYVHAPQIESDPPTAPGGNRLNSNQVRLTWERKIPLAERSGGGGGGCCCFYMSCKVTKVKKKKNSCEKTDFKTTAFSRHPTALK